MWAYSPQNLGVCCHEDMLNSSYLVGFCSLDQLNVAHTLQQGLASHVCLFEWAFALIPVTARTVVLVSLGKHEENSSNCICEKKKTLELLMFVGMYSLLIL